MNPTIINFPSVANPSRITWQLNRLDTRFKSPLSGTFQDIQRPGANWVCDMSWEVLSYADSQQLAAWSDQMSQAGVRTYLQNFIYIPQGSSRGAVVVNGANQTGTSLVCNQAPVGTNLVVAGDFIVITSGTHTQLLRITQNSSSDGSGNITLNFTPAMRFSPANGSQIFIGVTPTVTPAIYKSDWQGNQLQYSMPRTNLVSNGNTPGGTGWTTAFNGTGTAPTITLNYATGPDGTSGAATRLQANQGAGSTINDYSLVQSPSYTVVNGKTYIHSVWLKSNTGSNQPVYMAQAGLGAIAVTVTPAWSRFESLYTATANGTWGASIGTCGTICQANNSLDILAVYEMVEVAQAGLNTPTSYIPTTSAVVTVTDYTLAGNQLTFASAPANASVLTWTDGAGTIFHLPSGDGSTTVFYTGLPLVAFAFAKPSSSFTYTAPRIAALSLALEEDINV